MSASTIACIRSRIRKNPDRVQLVPTDSSSRLEPGTSTPAAIRNAADDGSPGTSISAISSSSTLPIVVRTPPPGRDSRCTVAPARISMRSVWSRVGTGSTTVVASVTSPASSTHDLTCALATGSSYSMPVSCAPCTVNGGNLPSRASIRAPICSSGPAMRSTGRRRIDSSPSSSKLWPCWNASHPGSSRISVPALPTSIAAVGGRALRNPPPRITSSSGRRSTIAPRRATAASVELVSAASR